jgi:hypothetical protein
MARAKKSKAPKSELIQALEFLLSMGKISDERSCYAMFDSFQARSFNSIIAVGTTIKEDLNACPHAHLLLEALLQAGDEYAITQLSPEKLLVRTDDFQAYIPCLPRELLSWPIPDAPMVPIDDRLIIALKKIVPLLNPVGETVLEQSIQLNAGSCIASNRMVIAEAWHGLDLPSGLLIPKPIVTALQKAQKGKKVLKAFGCSPVTATFYFEDDTWIRTQLFQDRWPAAITAILYATQVKPHAVPPYLFESANKVAPFSAGEVFIKDGLISSHPFDVQEQGSSLKLPIGSEHKERSYPIDNLDFASEFAEWWDEEAMQSATYFSGKEVRGFVSHNIPVKNKIAIEDSNIPF